MSSFIIYIYTVFKDRPYLRLGALLCIFLGIFYGLSCLKLQEDITQFIPQSDQHLARDMELLQKLPAQKQVLITLHKTRDAVSSIHLAQATKNFADALQQPLFGKVLFSPPSSTNFSSKNVLSLVPPLFTKEDAKNLQTTISKESLRQSLNKIISKSMGLEGIAQAENLAIDPLEISTLVLHKIGSLSQIKNIRVRHGVFMNPAETASLIIAHTTIKTTDSHGAAQLKKALDECILKLPKGIEASIVASQLYTAANAQTIQSDIFKVSCIGIIGLVLLMCIFLRTRHIFILFTIPLCAYAAGGAALGLFWDPASAMTFGFGPVLLGITIDFALHLYYVVTTRENSYEDALKSAARPICMSGITTILAFALLLFSSVAGVRQLAAFVVTGLIVALILALFFLPHFLKNSTTVPPTISFPYLQKKSHHKHPQKTRRILLIGWFCLSCIACFFLPALHFQQSLQSMGIQPILLKNAEKDFHATWGSSPSSSLLFSYGKSFDEALQNSEAAQKVLSSISATPSTTTTNTISHTVPHVVTTTLTELIPSPSTQQQNIERWKKFWQKNRNFVQKNLHHEAIMLGFKDNAFTPFYDFINVLPQEISITSLDSLGLHELVQQLFIAPTKADDQYIVLAVYAQKILFDDNLEKNLSRLQSRVITPADFGNSVGSTLSSSFATIFLCALLITFCVIAVILRDAKATLSAILPALWGLLIMGAVLGALHIPLGLFSLAGALLVLGHGVDYGIYMIHQKGHPSKGVTTAIFVSGITSLMGFGALTFAQHPALYSMGVSVFSGVLAAMLCALFVLPCFLKENE